VTPTVPVLAPAKALKLGTPATTRRRWERASRIAASVVATGECYDRGHKAAARRGGSGGLAGVGPPRPSPRALAGSFGEPSLQGSWGDRAPADGDLSPRRGQSRGRSGSAPEHTPKVLVMREDGCVMSQRPAHNVEASTSHTASPASDVACPLRRGPGRVGTMARISGPRRLDQQCPNRGVADPRGSLDPAL
jgi:hypothetical protein